jgi:hypothetical protein
LRPARLSSDPLAEEIGVPLEVRVSRREIAEIAALADPVLRNLRITQVYHELAAALAQRLGPDNVTWCAFATWASKTAGQAIRRESLRQAVQAQLEHAKGLGEALERANALGGLLARTGVLRRLEHTHVVALLEDVLERVAESVARGNLAVFSELAPVFVRLLEELGSDARPDADRLHRFLDAALPDAARQHGLREAMSAYYFALSDPDPVTKARRVLLGNLQAVLHEQVRLQGAIADSLDAPVQEVLSSKLQRRLLHVVPIAALRRCVERQAQELRHELSELWERVATEHLMSLDTSDERFALGSDVPPLPGKPLFPSSLAQFDDPELRAFIERWDRTRGRGVGSGARDWEELDDRMCFIVNLFRSRQQHRRLLDPPFSADQRSALARGALPDGPL